MLHIHSCDTHTHTHLSKNEKGTQTLTQALTRAHTCVFRVHTQTHARRLTREQTHARKDTYTYAHIHSHINPHTYTVHTHTHDKANFLGDVSYPFFGGWEVR